MPIQDFKLYTANGYAGDLVDSGPRVIQTGILTNPSAGFGLAMFRDISVDRGCRIGGAANVYAISQREYNHEASTRPAKAGDWAYLEGDSVSLIRQGYLYVKLTGATAILTGDSLHVDTSTGEFSKLAVAGDVVACTNVFAEENGIEGDIIKVRIDIK
jgi:hypothetical protein